MFPILRIAPPTRFARHALLEFFCTFIWGFGQPRSASRCPALKDAPITLFWILSLDFVKGCGIPKIFDVEPDLTEHYVLFIAKRLQTGCRVSRSTTDSLAREEEQAGGRGFASETKTGGLRGLLPLLPLEPSFGRGTNIFRCSRRPSVS